jgi:ATP synthase protein I
MKEKDKRLIKQVFHLSSIGMSMVLAIVIGLFAGILLDRKFDTAPWLTFIFLAFGIIAGFRNIFYIFKKYGLEYEDDEDEDEERYGR